MSVQLALFDGWATKLYRGRRRWFSDERWQTAVHEAGHAVMARALNVPFSLVTIRPALGKILGRVSGDFTGYLRGGEAAPIPNRIAALAAVLVAGHSIRGGELQGSGPITRR
jgi:hypothetical protein